MMQPLISSSKSIDFTLHSNLPGRVAEELSEKRTEREGCVRGKVIQAERARDLELLRIMEETLREPTTDREQGRQTGTSGDGQANLGRRALEDDADGLLQP